MNQLRAIKAAHTVIWAIFAACILAIPFLAWADRYHAVAWLTGLVLAELLILVLNGWQCPLTGIAAQYTDDRDDNFDIYLPVWLARHNKLIFGSIFVLGQIVVLARWLGR